MSAEESSPASTDVTKPSDDMSVLLEQLKEAKKLHSRYKRQLNRLKKDVAELSSHSAPRLAVEDFRATIHTSETLLKDYTMHSDLFQELMECIGDSDLDSTVEVLDANLFDLKVISREVHRLMTIRQAYMESITIKSKTEYLSSVDVLPGSKEQLDLNALREHVGKIAAVVEPLHCTELQELYKELHEREKLVTKRIRDASKAASEATSLTSTVVSPVTRTSTITMKLPSFDGDMVNWRKFWGLFSSKLEHEPGLLDVDRCCLLVNAMDDPEARIKAQDAVDCTENFDEAVKMLQAHYDDNRLLHRHHFERLTMVESFGCRTKDINRLQSKVNTAVRGLKDSNGYTAGQLVVATLINMFDKSMLQGWRQFTHKLTDPPELSHLLEFLDYQKTVVPDDRLSSVKIERSSKPASKRTALKIQESSRPSANKVKCVVCESNHPVFLCTVFKELSIEDRWGKVKQNRLCYNCLSRGHSVSSCTSKGRCRKCNNTHHTLLHNDADPQSHTSSTMPEPTVTSIALVRRPSCPSNTPRIPMTALAIASSGSHERKCRLQLDTGAMLSLVSARLAQSIGAHRIKNTAVTISGVGGDMFSSHQVELALKSLQREETMIIRANVVDAIPECHTSGRVPPAKELLEFQHLDLADPEYDSGSKIDILLGVDYCTPCVLGHNVHSRSRSMMATETIFGWTLTGVGDSNSNKHHSSSTCLKLSSTHESADNLLSRFWALEEIPGEDSTLTAEEQLAVSHFQDTHRREEDGRYVVGLPKRIPALELGKSRSTALRRYLSNEKSLRRTGQWEAFHMGVQEYIDLIHAEVVPLCDLSKPAAKTFYLPMHGVIKTSSTTTKLRVVFDASAKSTSGHSLNDTLLPGPPLYALLPTVLNWFRMFPVGMSGDISKMFREISLLEEDRDLHRLLHKDKSGTIQDCRMKRVTFGVTSSPYLASQVLHQLATDHEADYPRAACIIRRNFYVDDCLIGADSVEEASEIREELNQLLSEGRMLLRKWRSSSPALLATVPAELQETSDLDINLSPTEQGKALGLHWDTSQDQLHVSTPDVSNVTQATKRSVSSVVARVFDVMGWYAPAILPAKLILQEAWSLRVAWDDPLSDGLQQRWKSWLKEISSISQHPIQRCMSAASTHIQGQTLHGYCDASSKAYGGAVYLRTVHHDTTISVHLIMDKSRLAPLKMQTIPRLELCGAQLLSRLLKQVALDLDLPTDSIYAWTDSSVVLGWLKTATCRLKLYVSHRVTDILSRIPAAHWRYVHTSDNPADLVSRGVDPVELMKTQLWWKGPPWLSQQPALWPRRPDIDRETALPEIRPAVLVTSPPIEEFGAQMSSFTKLCRVTSWMLRFIHRSKNKDKSPLPEYLTSEEITASKMLLFRVSQHHTYPSVFATLQKRGCLPTAHQLSRLALFIDQQGLLRLGGRLQKAGLSTEHTHPLLLSTASHTVKLLVRESHIRSMHAGPSTMLARLATTYHIPGVKRLLKGISRTCVRCQRAYARTSQQFMGELPAPRLRPSRPFNNTGLDFAGPFTIKEGNKRKPVQHKAYVCIYVCFCTKAVHLDLVSDMTTDAFIASLRRFVALYGAPAHIYSDNGSNFIGANTELSALQDLFNAPDNKEVLHQFAFNKNFQWHFTPSKAPHFGGLWEAAVKSMKVLLRKVVGEHVLRTDEMVTILYEAAAILNSRPLAPLETHDTDGVTPLTPGHFIHGTGPSSLPHDREASPVSTYGKRWRLTQYLSNELWRRWRKEYLVHLQGRAKWKSPQQNVCVGDLVLLKDDDWFSKSWPLGKVTAVYPGTDGRVRAVDIRIKDKIYRRPVCKTVPVLGEDN